MTPEGRVKAAVNRVIDRFGTRIYRFMPVPAGYGPSSHDYLLCVNGHFVSIETKAPGSKPTPRQEMAARYIEMAGGTTLVIDGTENTVTYDQLEHFLCQILERPFEKPERPIPPALQRKNASISQPQA